MDSILVTGGAGFIGSNFIPFFLDKYEKYNIINLDLLTYAGDIRNFKQLQNDRHIFVEGDIRDKSLLTKLFNEYNIKHVIHFAAESHVDNSIENPTVFEETNVNGTLKLLEVARSHWMSKPNHYKTEFRNSRFHHISTDEVYGSLGPTGYFTEQSPYAPNSPYSASKAASDFFVRSYYHTYGMNVVTTNCSNNYGPRQHDEKLIPTMIRKALQDEELPIYGDGQNVRDWLYVEDHCRAIDLVFREGKSGETYLVGGNNEKTTLQIAELICCYLDEKLPKEHSYLEQIKFVQDRLGHDFRYAIDPSKLVNELNWVVEETFETGIRKTIEWYLNKYKGGNNNG